MFMSYKHNYEQTYDSRSGSNNLYTTSIRRDTAKAETTMSGTKRKTRANWKRMYFTCELLSFRALFYTELMPQAIPLHSMFDAAAEGEHQA